MLERILVGHGACIPDERFVVPANCYVITYSPENFILTNSAIAAIASYRQYIHKHKIAFNTPSDFNSYAHTLQQTLLDAEVTVHKPGDMIPQYHLKKLEGRKGVGSELQQQQFLNSIDKFKSCRVFVQDAESLSKKSEITNGKKVSKVSLEPTLNCYVGQTKDIQLFHWVACSVYENRKESGRTRCKEFSVEDSKKRARTNGNSLFANDASYNNSTKENIVPMNKKRKL